MNYIKNRISAIFNTAKKRFLAITVAIMIILCIFAGLTAINILFFKTESSVYKEALARIDAITVNGEITDINTLISADGGLPSRLFDIIYSKKSEGDIDTENSYKLISVICGRIQSGSVYLLAQLFAGRDAVISAGLYEFMVENMPEESAHTFTDTVITLYAMDVNMDLLWHAAAVDAVPRFNSAAEDCTLPVYIWDEAAQSKLENIDPFRIVYMDFSGYLNEYKNGTVNLTGCDGSKLYYRGVQAGQIGGARYVKFDYDTSDLKVFDTVFGGKHTPADLKYELKDGFTVSAALNETGALDVLYDVSPGVLVPVSWSPDFKDAARASQLIFFNTVPKIEQPAASAAAFDLSPYATGFGKEYGAVTAAYIIDLICNYSQYGDTFTVLTNGIVLPRLTDDSTEANEINIRIISEFLSLYGMYLPYLVAGDTDYSPVHLICDYSYTVENGIGSIAVKTSCFDFITEQTITRYAFYYYNESEKTEATLADFLVACQKNVSEAYFKIGSGSDAVAVQLNSEQVRFANSDFTRLPDSHSITADEITGVFRFNRSGPFRAVAEVGGKQYVFELPAGTDHGWDYYYILDNTKPLRGDNLGAYILVREKNKYIIECGGKMPDLLWIGEDKIAFTQQISNESCRIAVADLTKGKLTNEYILASDDISAKFGIDATEFAPKQFNILYFSLSQDGEALICRYFLILEKGYPAANEIFEEPAAAVQIYSENCEGYMRADLITGKLTFIDAQTTAIPTEFKEVTILPSEIRETGFRQDPETTHIDNAAVTLTIPVTWVTNSGYLFSDSTRTEENGYLYNKRFEGCYQLIRVGKDFIWDGKVNLRAAEQYGENHENSFGYGEGVVSTSTNVYTVVEYPGIYYIRVSEEFALFIRMYLFEDDPPEYAVILRNVIDSLKFTYTE